MEKTLLQELKEEVGSETYDKLRHCQQCGTCAGSCPLGEILDMTPRKILVLIEAGEIERVLRSKAIWYCVSCYLCESRCPRGNEPAEVIYALRRMAVKHGLWNRQVKIPAFYRSFVRFVRLFGRSYEPGLLMDYFLRTDRGKAVSIMPMAVKFFLYGLVGLVPKRVKNWHNGIIKKEADNK